MTLANAISLPKTEYSESLTVKRNDPKTAPNSYWLILKAFLKNFKFNNIAVQIFN